MTKNDYDKPKLTLLGVMSRPFVATFRAFVDAVRWFGSRPSDLRPDENDKKVQERQAIDRRKGR